MLMSLPQPSQTFFWTQERWGPALRCRPLLDVAPHLFTTRAIDVSRDPSGSGVRSVAASLGVAPDALVQVHQVHGREIVEVRDGFEPSAREADVLVSTTRDRAIGVRVADCVPILLADDTGGTVAAIHAGWRGVAQRVAIAAVDHLRTRLGVRPARLVAALGPGIGPCCYQVGEDTREAFRAHGHSAALLEQWFATTGPGRLHLDMWRAVRDQLEGAGMLPTHIFTAELCTVMHPEVCFSYRRDGQQTGRMGAFIRTGNGL
jgi:YfiH family protein